MTRNACKCEMPQVILAQSSSSGMKQIYRKWRQKDQDLPDIVIKETTSAPTKWSSSSSSDNNLNSASNRNNWRASAESSTTNSATTTTSANCDNYNPMCQSYESINSCKEFPIIKQSPRLVSDCWNKFSQRLRRQRSYSSHLENNWRLRLLMKVAIVLLLVFPHAVWSWSIADRDPSFYQQTSANDDYYSDVPEQHQFLLNSNSEISSSGEGLPVFGKSPRLIEGTVGQTVIMSCIVFNLAAKRVTWMRMKDLQILTHGPLLFTSDVRVSSERPYGDNTRWGLVISDLRLEDSGKYECQVNSNPEMKQEVELLVRDQQQSDMPFEPAGRTIIEGPREEVVKIGSVVVFACSARHQFSKSDQPPVVWLKDGNPIDKFETARGGVNVMTDWRSTSVTSKLTLITASSSENGVYSCTVPGSGTDKVTLFIDEAEAQANTHNGAKGLATTANIIHEIILLLLVCILLCSGPLMHL